MLFPSSADFDDLFRHVLPIRVHSVHIACCPPPGTKPLFTDCLLPNCYKIFDDWCESNNVTTHIGECRDAASKNLQAYGFDIRGIPERLGGTWNYKLWIDCIMRQSEIYRKASCQKSGRDKTCPAIQGKSTSTAVSVVSTERPSEASAVGCGGSQKDTKSIHPITTCREDTSKHVATPLFRSSTQVVPRILPLNGDSRRDLEPRGKTVGCRIHLQISETKKDEDLNKECSFQTLSKSSTSIHARKLHTLRNFSAEILVNTDRCADQGDNTVAKAAVPKTRGTVYSKRKYYKKKLKIESIANSKDTLLVENKALKEENTRLEALHSSALRIGLEETKKPFSNSHLGTSTMAPAFFSSTVLGNRTLQASRIGSTSTPFSRPPQVTQAASAGADLVMAGLSFQGELVGLADSADPRSRATICIIPPQQAVLDVLMRPTHLRLDTSDLPDMPVQNPALHEVYQLLHSIQRSPREVGNGFANQQLLDLLRPSPQLLQRIGVPSTPLRDSLFPSAQALSVTSRNLGALHTQNLHSSTAVNFPPQNDGSNQTLSLQASLFLQLLGSQQLQNPFQRM
jgi:hypothetical protein